jgi:uncharacterized protein DUF2510
MSEPPTGAPAGWYPNPENPAQQRYWDGQQWSAHLAEATAGSPTTAQPLAAGTAPAKKAIWTRWWFITAAAVVVILVIARIAGGGGDNNKQNAASTPSPNTNTSTSTSETPTPTATPTSTPTPTPTPTPAAPKSIRYSGQGDRLVKIRKPDRGGPALLSVRGTGSSSNFVVTSLDSLLHEVDLLVNVIGSYSGTVLMDAQDGQDTARLKIEYPGTWTVVLRPIDAAPEFISQPAGKGDRVFKYLGEAQGLKVTNRGSGNFIVETYGDEGDLLVNEIGNYSGEVVLGAGPELIQIQSDGHWTLKTTG